MVTPVSFAPTIAHCAFVANTHTCPCHSDVTSDTHIITLLPRTICNVQSHCATSCCMLTLILADFGAPCSYQSLPLATSHCLYSSSMPPKHIACYSMLQVGQYTLNNVAYYAHTLRARSKACSSLLRLATIFFIRVQHYCAPKPNVVLPPSGATLSQVDQGGETSITQK